ncbi:unnamed protein product [Adineta steineri]|uniref:SREBP regulating gene protein n=1 Tax=Adineta steineri TaxID=433720 RepID=A0A818HJL4_9BILA|nr:unnamed protein product [Adineta steineri]
MRIYFKQSALFVICLICTLIGIYLWRWWQEYKLIINHFTHPTPKTNLNDLEQAILLDNRLISKCQHFAQGKQSLVVDSKGYVCERRHLEKIDGCCQTTSSSILGPYICDTCSSTTRCCSSFEHCISCCLKPDHRIYLQNYIRSRDLKTKLLLSHLSTLFDVCVSRCRTHNEKEIVDNPQHSPFNIQWLDTSYQQTCLPDSPWQQVLDDLEPVLFNRIHQQFNNSQRRQILIELLGSQFQQKFFVNEPDNPHILMPPNMLKEDRTKLENEAKSWLQIQTLKAATEIDAVMKENDHHTNHLSNDMKNFLTYTNQTVSTSFERYLNQLQQKQEEEKLQELNKIKRQKELTGSSKLRSILPDSRMQSRKLSVINKSPSFSYSTTSQYSDVISSSIVALLKHDLRRITFIKEKLFGQQLPIALREISWTEYLLRSEKKSFDYNLHSIEHQIRRDFAAGITRGKNELKLMDPLNTPMKNLIENDVIDTYSKTYALQSYLKKYHLRLTIKTLNVLYTYRKDYETYFIYWLLPFQLSFMDEIHKDEEIYVSAMYLDLFIRHCFPTWSNIFTIASKIMSDIAIHDQEFYNHIKKTSKIDVKINTKDFVTEIISLENEQSENVKQYNNEIMTDPVIFLRKWICEMFVGILNSNAVLYLWDQFFMVKWNTTYIEHATKAILYLLRDKFLCTTDYEEIRQVFLEEPYLLYTSDIQTAFVHLALKHDNPKYIPAMNQRVHSLKPMDNIQYISNKHKTYVGQIGIKNISLNLISPVTKDPREEFQYKSLVVEIQAHGGGENLGSISTQSVPVIRKEQTTHGQQKITIDLLDDKLILLIKQTRQSFISARIQAVVIVQQQLDANTLKILGHCRFPLYIPQKIGNLDTWDVTFGLVERALHSGIPPTSIDMIPDIPKPVESDKIDSSSIISLVIFDPKAEQHFAHLFIYNYRGYYQKTKRILVIFLPIFTVATFIIYIIYMFNINYRTMNLFTINMMNNDRHQSLLSNTLRYHKCCRIQEEILFDSQNEREYFRLFPHCQKSIEENEKLKDHWDNITTCGTLFKSIVFYTRFILIIDLILNFSIMTVSLIHIWEETDEWVNDNQCTLTITDNINYKAK